MTKAVPPGWLPCIKALRRLTPGISRAISTARSS
jgi:hypothetical protein